MIPDYVDALLSEIQSLRSAAEERLHVRSIFFGGGTPSILPAVSIAKIFHILDSSFNLAPDIEISLEANPGTLSLSYLQDLSALGIDRISLGMQSAHPRELALLDRQHQFDDVLESVKWIRQAGIENLNLDLIFGLPEQPVEIWDESLTQALNLGPQHLSLYALTIEEGTPMNNWATRGLISLPDPDLAAEMYDLASEKLLKYEYCQYEISNWAKENKGGGMGRDSNWSCRHNLQYWRNQPYFGFGAGAHGYVDNLRMSNVLTPKAYIEHLTQPYLLPKFPRTPATVNVQPINLDREMGETMMMGMRLTQEGVSRTAFQARFKLDLYDVFRTQIEKLMGWGLVEWVDANEDILRLTYPGRLLGNRVFSEFI